MEDQRPAVVQERVGEPRQRQGAAEEILAAEENSRRRRQELELQIDGQRGVGVEPEKIGAADFCTRAALHYEQSVFGGNEEANNVALQTRIIGVFRI